MKRNHYKFTQKIATAALFFGFMAGASSLKAQTVFDVIANSPNHTILEAALIQEGLDVELRKTGPFTVFAPDDAAFNQYLSDNNITSAQLLANPELKNILLHHVVSGTVLSTDLTAGEVVTLNGADVTVNLTGGVFIDDAEVTTADLTDANGVVHVINGLLIPTFDDVTEVVSRSPDHTILLQALVKANLVSTLQGAGPYTVFAPDDSAFIRFLAANMLTAQQLLDNADLCKILLNHVVGSYLNASDLVAGPVTTLNNTEVIVNLTGGVKIGPATVTSADIDTDNGVVHVINDILVPGTASRKTIKNNGIAIFPNPTNGTLFIANSVSGKYEIISLQGQVVQKGTMTQSSLSVANLPAGNYVLKVSSDKGVSTAQFNKL
jgi:uncharacterized surface protein with fasciclin (FAS1) repeats